VEDTFEKDHEQEQSMKSRSDVHQTSDEPVGFMVETQEDLQEVTPAIGIIEVSEVHW
jgi:hypothetical protein